MREKFRQYVVPFVVGVVTVAIAGALLQVFYTYRHITVELAIGAFVVTVVIFFIWLIGAFILGTCPNCGAARRFNGSDYQRGTSKTKITCNECGYTHTKYHDTSPY